MNRDTLKGYFPWLVIGLCLAVALFPLVLNDAYLLRIWMLLLIYAVIALG